MQLQPIVYVSDMTQSVEWFRQLLAAAPTVESGHWSTFAVGDGTLALHLTDDVGPLGSVELSLVAEVPLEDVASRFSPIPLIDEQPFGRSFTVVDPDGTKIQVNEHA